MLGIWKRNRVRKQARELLHVARKLVRLNRDLLDDRRIAEVNTASAALAGEIRGRDLDRIEAAFHRLETALGKVFPAPPHASWRENVEVFLVAAIVAMSVRTFFLQPFKIPTGSMQPTLYGVYPPRPPESRYEPPLPYEGRRPSLPEKLLGIAAFGRIYETTGYRSRGDHIFVDKISYHFRKPHRGEIIVFKTDNIPDLPDSLRGRFYIKRLIALPGDTVQITPPHVRVNGEILDSRPAFHRIYSGRGGYEGYSVPQTIPRAKYIGSTNIVYQVPADSLFVLGDNTNHSLDGRYWGAFPKADLVGQAVFVYWPLSDRFGLVD